jgi:hypothetical protein
MCCNELQGNLYYREKMIISRKRKEKGEILEGKENKGKENIERNTIVIPYQ